MDDKLGESIAKKLNVLIALTLNRALNSSPFQHNKKETGDKIRYLASFGLNPNDIAEITGSPVQSVRTLLTPSRKK